MRRRVRVGKSFALSVDVDDTTNMAEARQVRKVAPKRVAVGKPLDIRISLTGDAADYVDANTRRVIVLSVLGCSVLALCGAAAWDVVKNDNWFAVHAVWGPVYGAWCAIGGYFLAQHRGKHKK